MNSNEKKRTLTEAEKKRLDRFNEIRKTLEDEGYAATELTIGIVKANIVALLSAVPIVIIAVFLFFVRNGAISFDMDNYWRGYIIFIVSFIVLIVVHELIHGVTWGILSGRHFKDIEFGFIKEYLTPYCTCSTPLNKPKYITGALMPLLILGIIPTIAAIFMNSFLLLIIGLVMVMAAGGDVMIVCKLLSYKSASKDILIYDHPTQGGSVVFER